MKAYKVSGHFEMGWLKEQAFNQEIAAASKEAAKEAVLAGLGSKHKVRRRQIKIEKIEEISSDAVKSAIIRRKVGAKDAK